MVGHERARRKRRARLHARGDVPVRDGDSYRDVLLLSAEGNDRLGRIPDGSAVFAAGELVRDLDRPATVDQLDVLPPFAGG